MGLIMRIFPAICWGRILEGTLDDVTSAKYYFHHVQKLRITLHTPVQNTDTSLMWNASKFFKTWIGQKTRPALYESVKKAKCHTYTGHKVCLKKSLDTSLRTAAAPFEERWDTKKWYYIFFSQLLGHCFRISYKKPFGIWTRQLFPWNHVFGKWTVGKHDCLKTCNPL